MAPKKQRNSTQRTKAAEGRFCPSCGTAALADARFCHACGAALEGGGGGGKRTVRIVAAAGGAAALVAVAAVAVVMFSEPDRAPPASSAVTAPRFDAPPMASSGGMPDLSQMTPRAAADRLFNRVMTASEQGNRDEALRFAPMAVQAYGALPALDRDAHYHLGLIHGVAGDRASVEGEIAALKEGAPNHLLALMLEHDIAKQAGDRTAAARLVAAFTAAYETEMAMARPEYEAHRGTIERFRAAAVSGAAPSSPAPFAAAPSGSVPSAAAPSAAASFTTAPSPVRLTGPVLEGAGLFAKNCTACHGPDARGSDKGPPLVHKIYEPSHHDDDAIRRAVRQGVAAHHWPFGDMQPVPGVSDAEVGKIIAYVRELQRAAGIQ